MIGEDEGLDEDIPDSFSKKHLAEMFRNIPDIPDVYRGVGVCPVEFAEDSSDQEMLTPNQEPDFAKASGDLELSVQSLSDLDKNLKENHTDLSLRWSLFVPGLGNRVRLAENAHAFDRHASILRSFSTPAIHKTSETSGYAAQVVRKRQEQKTSQIRKQKEVDYDDEEGHEKVPSEEPPKMGSSEEPSPNDSDERSETVDKKCDKKKAQSVLSIIRRKTDKKKDKKIPYKSNHHFISISVSNTSTCDVCHKPMANKSALRCEDCLLSVHEHNCKDQVNHCDKTRSKVLQKDAATHAGHGPPHSGQVHSLEQKPVQPTGVSIRHSQSMKDSRPTSLLLRTQEQLSSLVPSHRNSLPTPRKDVSEDCMVDSPTVDACGDSNINDAISESLESLDGVIPSDIFWLDDEPDLQLAVEEGEAWSTSANKDILKKLSKTDIKRQDTIWELIITEKQYVKRLKIMQKIFVQSMIRDLNYTVNIVDKLFPRLDELVDLHAKFLCQLLSRQSKNEHQFVEEIGDILVGQFQGSTGEKMKSIYGVFCSKHTEAMQQYKELVKVDRKFQMFARKCYSLPVCEKREINDFILGVTVRLSKYAILIEAILKNTKDKRDRENLSQAFLSCKDVVQHVDEKVAAYMRLVDIVSKMDSKAVLFKARKFKRHDLIADKRELLHVGRIGWKNARGRVLEALAVVLTDLVVFLHKNEQKYTFLTQDNKSCVIPLHNLVVREKRDERGSLGIYIISQNHTTPEMYEFVCQSKSDRKQWILVLQHAIRACPADVELEPRADVNHSLILFNQVESSKEAERGKQMKFIIEQLHQKDEVIRECCDEKSKLMLKLLELSSPCSETRSSNSDEIVSMSESMEVVHAAMQEASRLTTYLQSSGTHLSRSVSSAGEHQSHMFINTLVPRRAETFSGSDFRHDSVKGINERFIAQDDGETRSPSVLSLDQQEVDNSFFDTPDTVIGPKHEDGVSESDAARVAVQPFTNTYRTDSQSWAEHVSPDWFSDQDSLGEPSLTSLSPPLAGQEQMTCIFQLVQYLNILMNLTSKQCTKVESLRAELAEAKEKISRLSADMLSRRSVYRHDQLEELRNLQESISQEKQEWERRKLRDGSLIEREREKLEKERREIEKEKV